MQELPLLVLRALIGGILVVAFSLVSETLRPKAFAGLFGAAPSVAVGSLLITSLVKGRSIAVLSATGMLAGASAMVVYCVTTALLLPRLGSLWGSVASWGVWGIAAGGLYAAFLR